MDTLVEKITRKIAEAIHPDKIILFGSRAKGTATPDSDVDLVVIYSGPKSRREIEVEIDRLFNDRDFSMDVFIMRPDHFESYKKVVNTLAYEIFKRGKVCYG